jgi:diguanylate cyclase (GGDEF)-like protein/PAS domain S-box-containing protein
MDLDEPLDGMTTFSMYSQEQLALIHDVVMPALERHGHWRGTTSYVNRRTGEVTDVESDVQVMDDPLRPGMRIFATVSRDITEMNRAAAAERRRRELGVFAARLAQHALDADRDELFADSFTVLEPFAKLLRADLAYLDVIDLDAGVLRPLGDWTSARYRLPFPPPPIVPVSDLPHWIAHLQGPRMVLGSTTDEYSSLWASELEKVFGVHPGGSNLYAPLRVRNVLIGVLGLSNFDDGHTWSTDEIDTVQQVADTLANLLGRQRSDDALRTSERHLAAMLANVKDVLVVVDRDGTLRYVNDALGRIFGLQPEDVLGQPFLTFVHPDDHVLASDNFAATLGGRTAPSLSELRVVTTGGRPVWVEVETPGIFDDVLGGFVFTLRDISVQRAAEEATRRRERFERVVLGLARWALDTKSKEPMDGLAGQLEELGLVLGCDTAAVSLLDGSSIRTVAQWHDPRVGREPESGGETVDGGARSTPALADRYRDLEPLVVRDLDTVDAPWADECRSLPTPLRSSIHVPLVSGDLCLGDVAVAMLDTVREWSSDEVALVQRVSETLASLLVRQRIEASLRTSEARLAALLNGSHDLVVVVDGVGTIQFANWAVHRRLGYRPEDLVGTNVASVVHPDDIEEALRRLHSLFTDQPTMMLTLRLIDANGSIGWWEITSGAIRDTIAGGLVLICRDVTSRRRSEEAHSRRMEHLRYAFDLAQTALDLDTQQFFEHLDGVCASIAQLLHVDSVSVDQIDQRAGRLVNRAASSGAAGRRPHGRGAAVGLERLTGWLGALRAAEPVVVDDARSDDREWLIDKRRELGDEAAFVAVGMSTAGDLVGVLNVSMTDQPRAWTTDDVTFLRIVAETIAHVFERARIDQALRASEARFRLLSETAADVVILLDAAGVVRYASPSSKELLGFTPEQLVGRSARSLVHPDDARRLPVDAPALLSGLPFVSEGRLVRADGSSVWVANSTSAVLDPVTGRPIEFRTSVRDITERKRLEAELERQALHDPLTGLANRILLQRCLAQATSPDREAPDVAVLLLDLDGFKNVNDTYGHAIGDDVLRIVASRLSALSRPTDTLARTGGDEFVVLCPATDIDGATRIATRIIAAVSEPIRLAGESVMLGASVGVAHHGAGAANPDVLLLEADAAMYTAKRAGRGRLAVADDQTRAFTRSTRPT